MNGFNAFVKEAVKQKRIAFEALGSFKEANTFLQLCAERWNNSITPEEKDYYRRVAMAVHTLQVQVLTASMDRYKALQSTTPASKRSVRDKAAPPATTRAHCLPAHQPWACHQP